MYYYHLFLFVHLKHPLPECIFLPPFYYGTRTAVNKQNTCIDAFYLQINTSTPIYFH